MRQSQDMTKGESSEENTELEWMIRPCQTYRDEYDDCKSIRARFHQYFVFGEMTDCSQWKVDYENCCLWEKNKSRKTYNELLESEKVRRLHRLKGHVENNVWEKRDKPPENWNAPLPEWIESKNKNSYLKCVSENLKQGQTDKKENSLCIIM